MFCVYTCVMSIRGDTMIYACVLQNLSVSKRGFTRRSILETRMSSFIMVYLCTFRQTYPISLYNAHKRHATHSKSLSNPLNRKFTQPHPPDPALCRSRTTPCC